MRTQGHTLASRLPDQCYHYLVSSDNLTIKEQKRGQHSTSRFTSKALYFSIHLLLFFINSNFSSLSLSQSLNLSLSLCLFFLFLSFSLPPAFLFKTLDFKSRVLFVYSCTQKRAPSADFLLRFSFRCTFNCYLFSTFLFFSD